ncbi:MAG: hypothetical protein LH467_13670 [Gemmatimonadaceae bacterium]|nr:hypothetical protein [Gemmatimonadaceae bacterium]
MIHCVAIHSNGTSEVLEFKPKVHQDLRGLGYRRFVVRTADERALSSAVYSRGTPSLWQFSDAAKKLWGRGTGDIHVFDEHGEPVVDAVPGSDVSGSHAVTSTARAGSDDRELDARDSSESKRQTPLSSRTVIDPQHAPELITRANNLLPASDPRKITPATVADMLRAAHAIRHALDGTAVADDGTDRRALADRLDTHARALESYLRARSSDPGRR